MRKEKRGISKQIKEQYQTEGKLKTKREGGPTKDGRPGSRVECWNIPVQSCVDEGPVDGGVAPRETSPKTLVPLHLRPGFV